MLNASRVGLRVRLAIFTLTYPISIVALYTSALNNIITKNRVTRESDKDLYLVNRMHVNSDKWMMNRQDNFGSFGDLSS